MISTHSRADAAVSHIESLWTDQRELAERIRAGDLSGFSAFLRENWAGLVRYIASFLGSADEAKDIAQEAFVRLWEGRSGLRPHASARPYLYRIARNLAINERRRRELQRLLAARQAEDRPSVRTPASELEATELRAIIERAIESLPDRRREAFVLAHLQNMPHREIAEIMGISPQTVANQISTALAQLRESLAPYLDWHGEELQRSG